MDIVGATRRERNLLGKLLEGVNIGVVTSPKSRKKRRHGLAIRLKENTGKKTRNYFDTSKGSILRAPEQPRLVMGCLIGMRSSSIDTKVAFYDPNNIFGLFSSPEGDIVSSMPEIVQKEDCVTTLRAFSKSIILEQIAPELRTRPTRKIGHGVYERDESVYKDVYMRFANKLQPFLGQRLYVAVLELQTNTSSMAVFAWDVCFYGPNSYYDFDHYSLIMKKIERYERVYTPEDFESTVRRITFGT